MELTLSGPLREETLNISEGRIIAALLPATRYRRRASRLIGLDHAPADKQSAFLHCHKQLVQQTIPVALWEFPGGCVTGKGAVITAAGRLIRESVVQEVNQKIVPAGLTSTGLDTYRTSSGSRDVPGTALLIETTFDDNYGHWMVQGAALLMLMHDFIAEHRPALIMGTVPRHRLGEIKTALLSDLGAGGVVVEHRPDEVLRVERLLYVTPLHGPPLMKRPETLRALRHHLLNAAYAGTPPMERFKSRRRRLYLARKSYSRRELLNREALEATLRAHDFEIFFAEDHSFEAQVRAFAEAEMVLGVKGAALTNILFCAPNTRVIVLTPPSWPDPFFWDIAGQGGLEYIEILGVSYEEGFEIDLPSVIQCIVA